MTMNWQPGCRMHAAWYDGQRRRDELVTTWVVTLSDGDETDSRSGRGKWTKSGKRASNALQILLALI
jgi:hypothetical protein